MVSQLNTSPLPRPQGNLVELLAEEIIVLVKAVPQVGARHGETVCCAGVTATNQWRRLFPIRFRQLSDDAKFVRWQRLSYRAHRPTDDARVESRRVHEESLSPGLVLADKERVQLVSRLVVPSAIAAAEHQQSLALVRPTKFEFYSKLRKSDEHERLKRAYAEAGKQTSFLDKELSAFEPPRYEFRVSFKDSSGEHDHECGDWETIAAFRKFSKLYGDDEAITRLSEIYNKQYAPKGLVVALGTMKKRPQTWLMLGIIRADDALQMNLF